MTDSQTLKATLFLDFDGTVTCRDVVDVILQTYADAQWLRLEADWRAGRMGSRDCLQAQMSLVRATRRQLDTLLDSIAVDEGLINLLELCAALQTPAHIISDGFDYSINRIISRVLNGCGSLIKSVCASHLNISAHPWRTEFPYFHQSCGHGCATCKPAVMRLLNPGNLPAIFVGDGLSDRYAVESADLVFAKNELAGYCHANSIAHAEYKDLTDVAAYLEHWLTARVFVKDRRTKCVSA